MAVTEWSISNLSIPHIMQEQELPSYNMIICCRWPIGKKSPGHQQPCWFNIPHTDVLQEKYIDTGFKWTVA